MGPFTSALWFVFRWSFAWVRCLWCGTWFPLWGKPEWGPRTPENRNRCKHCSRIV